MLITLKNNRQSNETSKISMQSFQLAETLIITTEGSLFNIGTGATDFPKGTTASQFKK